jgi:hypothetical protein
LPGVQYRKFVDKNLKQFLGAFAKLWKPTISFVMSVCLSVCLSVRPSLRLSVRIGQLGYHLTNFHEFWYLGIFRKSVEKVQVWLKSDKNNGHFTWKTM